MIARRIPKTDVERIAGSVNLKSPLARIQLVWANPNATPEMMTWRMVATPLDMSISMVQRQKKTSSTMPPTSAERIPRSLNSEISFCFAKTKGMAFIVYKT